MQVLQKRALLETESLLEPWIVELREGQSAQAHLRQGSTRGNEGQTKERVAGCMCGYGGVQEGVNTMRTITLGENRRPQRLCEVTHENEKIESSYWESLNGRIALLTC